MPHDASALLEPVAAHAGAADVAEYIGEMTRELAQVAQHAGLPVLAYLLELANGEAQAMMLLARDEERHAA